MSRPKASLRIEGTRLAPLEGLSNSISLIIGTKCDEILVNPTTGSQTLTGSRRIFSLTLPIINLRSTSHNHIQQLLCSQLGNFPSLCEILAIRISTAATNLGFGSNGFVMNVFLTITQYRHTIAFVMSVPPFSSPPSHSNDDKNSLNAATLKMVLRGRINGEELASLKTETESCSICLDDLTSSNSKRGKPTRMTCSHVFHGRCLMEWLDRKNTCPLCRTVLYDR